jgi:hypothetical protein
MLPENFGLYIFTIFYLQASSSKSFGGAGRLGGSNPNPSGAEKKAQDESDAKDLIAQIKAMTGLFDDVDPPNSGWMELSRRNFATQAVEKMVKHLCVHAFLCLIKLSCVCLGICSHFH